MSGIRTLAILNFLITSINFAWIILLDTYSIFGKSIGSTLEQYPTYLSPADFSQKIWILIAAIMSGATYLMIQSTYKVKISMKTSSNISKIDYLLILNQFFCGMSMILMINTEFMLSLIFSLATLWSILVINKRLNLQKITMYSPTRYFTRLGFSLYTGWIIVIIIYTFPLLYRHFNTNLNPNFVYILNMLVLVGLSGATLYYAFKYSLPAVSSVLTWGIFCIIFKQHISAYSPYPDMKYWLYFILLIAAIFTLINYYRCYHSRKIEKKIREQLSSIP
ncbi:MAG: hypothetical protein ACRDE7_00395 [Sphingobacterium sp.]